MLAFVAVRVERGGGVLHFEDLKQRVHVQRGQGAIGSEARKGVADVEFLVEKPDVRLDTDTACLDGGIQWDATPVIIVRVTWDREDSAGKVCGP